MKKTLLLVSCVGCDEAPGSGKMLRAAHKSFVPDIKRLVPGEEITALIPGKVACGVYRGKR